MSQERHPFKGELIATAMQKYLPTLIEEALRLTLTEVLKED
jgi:hypothetical protein